MVDQYNLPKRGEKVLVFDKSMGQFIGVSIFAAYWVPSEYMESGIEWRPLVGKDYLLAHPTHWMPLPAEPKE